jgi:hypothetical protein
VGLSLRELLVLGVALCGCVASCCWCLLYGFRPVSSINKPGTSFLINGWGKAFAPHFTKKKMGLIHTCDIHNDRVQYIK